MCELSTLHVYVELAEEDEVYHTLRSAFSCAYRNRITITFKQKLPSPIILTSSSDTKRLADAQVPYDHTDEGTRQYNPHM